MKTDDPQLWLATFTIGALCVYGSVVAIADALRAPPVEAECRGQAELDELVRHADILVGELAREKAERDAIAAAEARADAEPKPVELPDGYPTAWEILVRDRGERTARASADALGSEAKAGGLWVVYGADVPWLQCVPRECVTDVDCEQPCGGFVFLP